MTTRDMRARKARREETGEGNKTKIQESETEKKQLMTEIEEDTR